MPKLGRARAQGPGPRPQWGAGRTLKASEVLTPTEGQGPENCSLPSSVPCPSPQPLLELGRGREQARVGGHFSGEAEWRGTSSLCPAPVFLTLAPHPGRSRK